jgi:hypothetical protein
MCSNQCTTTDELNHTLSISKGSITAMTEGLGYSKVYTCWVPKMLKDASKELRKLSPLILCQYDSEGEGLLLQTVMGDEIWAHHFEWKCEWQLFSGIMQHSEGRIN